MAKITSYNIILGIVGILFLTGCAGFGPKTIPRDRFNYATAISNSWKNQMLLNKREATPEFYRLISLLRDVQRSGAVGMHIEVGKDKKMATVFTFRAKNIALEVLTKIRSAKRILGLEPDRQEFKVVYGSTPRDETEVAVLSRSMLEIIIELASYIDVPDKHIAEGRTYETLIDQMDVSAEFGPLITIYSDNDTSKPEDDFVAVRYNGHWFWIDDRDFKSKQMFSFLMLLFSFTESEKAYAPVVTIPTG